MKHRFNEAQTRLLEANPNVKHASDRSISYEPEFKLRAVKEYKLGNGPQQIFIQSGFSLEIIGSEKPKQCLMRWRSAYEKYGEEAFTTKRRGKASTGRPSLKEETAETRLKKAEARIKYPEAENDLLKKLEELARDVKKTK